MAQAKKTKSAKPAKQPAMVAAVGGEKMFQDAVTTMGGLLQASGSKAPELLRSIAETSLTQARDAYGRMKSATEDATDVLEETLENTRDGVLAAQYKALDVAQDNTTATIEFAKKLLAVTSLADAVQLQTRFMRDRFEAFIDYGKGVQAASSKLLQSASEPARIAASRHLNEIKTA